MKGKIMGLPTYVWLGVIAGGLLLGIYLRSRSGGSSGTLSAQNVSYPTDLPFEPGLAGSSLGGQTAADTSALDSTTLSDLMNGFATLAGDVEGNTEQVASLAMQIGDGTGTVTGQAASSGGSGASAAGTKSDVMDIAAALGVITHKETPHHKKVKKAEHHKHKKRKKVAA